VGTDVEWYGEDVCPWYIRCGTVKGHEDRGGDDVVAGLAGVRGEEEWGVVGVEYVHDTFADVLLVVG